jgi:hypothetical protein
LALGFQRNPRVERSSKLGFCASREALVPQKKFEALAL